jgi:hypothetical protein
MAGKLPTFSCTTNSLVRLISIDSILLVVKLCKSHLTCLEEKAAVVEYDPTRVEPANLVDSINSIGNKFTGYTNLSFLNRTVQTAKYFSFVVKFYKVLYQIFAVISRDGSQYSPKN